MLIVDDCQTDRFLLRLFLRRLRCEAVEATSGEEALLCCANERFDLVLMDCRMPVMDGLEATRRIRECEKCSERVPIVAVTATVLGNCYEACVDAGMDDMIGKPVFAAKLEAVVRRYRP